MVLLELSSIQVENKWRKNLLTSELLCQTDILQLKQGFNLQIKIIKISCPTLDNLFGILGMTSAMNFHNHCGSCFVKKKNNNQKTNKQTGFVKSSSLRQPELSR